MRALTLLALCLAMGAAAEIRVEDSVGREVLLEAPAQRIVALAPHIVENLFSAGAGAAVVATVEHADFPPQATSLARLGSAHAWSLEALVAQGPDLVVLWGSGNGVGALEQLERLGLTVYVSEPRRLADIAAELRNFGVLAGTADVAGARADGFEQHMRALRARYGERDRQDVFYEIWNRPLQTVNGEHMISAVIKLCGGRNIFADTHQLAPVVGMEAVLERDPDAIFSSPMAAARATWLDAWQAYPQLQAVRREALFYIHPDVIQRPTLRIATGATQLCSHLDSLRDPGAQAQASP